MDKLHCALCGTDHGKLVAHHFVTVDVVEDEAGEMVGGTPEHHNIYLCKKCQIKQVKKVPRQTRMRTIGGCLGDTVVFGGSLLLVCWASFQIPLIMNGPMFVLTWMTVVFAPRLLYLLFRHLRYLYQRPKLQKIAAALHDGSGPVRVFTLEQFWDFEARRKHTDGAKSLPTLLTPKGRTIDLGDSTQPDEFLADEADSMQHHERR